MSAPTIERATACTHPGCVRPVRSRGYCGTCHRRLMRSGQLIARETYSLDQIMDEWAFLRGWVAWEEFGARLGIKQESWERAYARARAAGDPRAVRALNDPLRWDPFYRGSRK